VDVDMRRIVAFSAGPDLDIEAGTGRRFRDDS
jgi:hypothetical protein